MNDILHETWYWWQVVCDVQLTFREQRPWMKRWEPCWNKMSSRDSLRLRVCPFMRRWMKLKLPSKNPLRHGNTWLKDTDSRYGYSKRKRYYDLQLSSIGHLFGPSTFVASSNFAASLAKKNRSLEKRRELNIDNSTKQLFPFNFLFKTTVHKLHLRIILDLHGSINCHNYQESWRKIPSS